MRAPWFAALLLLAVVVAAPLAAAQTDAERQDACLVPDVEALCDLAIAARFADMFPGFADLMFFLLIDLVVVLVLVGVIWVLRAIRPFPTLRFKAHDRVKEVPPGGRVTFQYELENQLGNRPMDVILERPDLPGFWDAELEARTELDSGFLIPHHMGEDHGTVQLSSRQRGANHARLALAVKAPADTSFEETLEYSLRAVPVIDGHVKKGKAKTAKVTVLVSPEVPAVQILDVVHDPDRIVADVPVSTRVKVANRSEEATDGADVVLYLNGDAVGRKRIGRLEPDAEDFVEFEWTAKRGENRVRLAVE